MIFNGMVNLTELFPTSFHRRTALLILGILVTALVFVCFSPTDNWSWDPSFYYAQLRSPIIDKDIDFHGETWTGSIVPKNTALGLQPSPWPLGPSILWSPFFLIAHLILKVANPPLADGYSSIYIALVSFGSMLYGALSLTIIYKICRKSSSIYLSAIATLLCLAGTPLFYYMFHQPLMAHTTGIFASAALLFTFILLEEGQLSSRISGLAFGILLGLNFLTRWAGILLVVVPLVYFSSRLIAAFRHKNRLTPEFLQIGIFLVILFLTISPQIAFWYRLHGRIFVFPQGMTAFIDSSFPLNLWKVLLDTNRGVVFWAPFVVLGFLGLFWIRPIKLRGLAITYCLLSILVIGYREDWYSGGGFGARYFIEMLPYIAVGFISLLNKPERYPLGQVLIAIGSAGLIIHQMMLVFVVEQAASLGWINLADYFNGRPIGIRWQIDSLVRLAKYPSLWFSPRIDTQTDRQTIVVNLVNHVRDRQSYGIQGIVLFLTPLAFGLLVWIDRKFKVDHLPILYITGVIVMVIWAIFLFIVG